MHMRTAIETIVDGGSKLSQKKLLMDRLLPFLPELKLVNEHANDIETLIYQIDKDESRSFFEKSSLPKNAFKIFIVHELHRSNIPFLKEADHIIFLSPLQKVVCEDVLGLKYGCEVMTFPHGGSSVNGDREDCFLYFEDPFTVDNIHYYRDCFRLTQLNTGRGSLKSCHLVFKVLENESEPFEDFCCNLQFSTPIPLLFHNSLVIGDIELTRILSGCKCGEYFVQDYTRLQFDDAISQKKSLVVYKNLTYPSILSDMAYSGIKIYDSHSSLTNSMVRERHDVPDPESWAKRIREILDSERPARLGGKTRNGACPAVDSLRDLNIVSGSPLSNKFIFSICFRNQAEKIARCLRSILRQDGGFDIGIAIVDDCSSDGSCDIIRRIFEESPIDHVLVTNQKRKYASRNFYNLTRYLVGNPESIVIELDGDDFLPDRDVVGVLKRHYDMGFVKTCGSFETYPNDSGNMFSGVGLHFNMDLSRPWDLTKCNAWLPLRSCKADLLWRVEIDHFLNRHTNDWLSARHDASVQPRLIELSEGKTAYINERLYVYDVSGDAHDHGAAQDWDSDHEALKLFHQIDQFNHLFFLS